MCLRSPIEQITNGRKKNNPPKWLISSKETSYETDGLPEGVDGEGNGDIKFNIEFEDDREREIYGLGDGLGLSMLGDRFENWSIS